MDAARSPFAHGLLMAVALTACGGGRPESPETFAHEVFDVLTTRNESAFLAYRANLDDVLRDCPEMTADDKTAATFELAQSQGDAARAYETCMATLQLDGATFERVDRAPSDILTLRWHGCANTLHFPNLRVTFRRNGQKGSFLLTDVMDYGGKWRMTGTVRLCEQVVP